ncbi:MAG: hypothetical protein R2911_24345 [Caldilineaceae bacterium]
MANNRPKSKKRDRSKSISSVQPRNYSEYLKKSEGAAANVVPEQPAAPTRSTRVTVPAGKGSETVDWQGEYGHVLRDLRTMFIVTVFLFAVMIGTGFFL